MIQAIDRPKIEMYAAGLGVAVNIILNIVLIPSFGIVGAALATVAGYVVFNTAEVSGIYWLSGAHPFSLNTLEPLVVTTVVGIGIARITTDLTIDLPGLIGIGILLLVVQLGALAVTRSFEEADMFIFRQAIDRLK